jgi:hypothetical protein
MDFRLSAALPEGDLKNATPSHHRAPASRPLTDRRAGAADAGRLQRRHSGDAGNGTKFALRILFKRSRAHATNCFFAVKSCAGKVVNLQAGDKFLGDRYRFGGMMGALKPHRNACANVQHNDRKTDQTSHDCREHVSNPLQKAELGLPAFRLDGEV